MESANKSNKIREIVRLQQILKKWKKIAAASSNSNSNSKTEAASASKTKTISPAKFLKKTLSFSNSSSSSSLADTTSEQEVPKGYLAVCVGRETTDEMKRFVIPTDYLTHKAFGILLRDAEEEFGFQQEGILRIPCDIPVFENILKTMHHRNKRLSSSSASSSSSLHDHHHHREEEEITIVGSSNGFCSSYSPPPPHSERSSSSSSAPHSSPHLQLCR